MRKRVTPVLFACAVALCGIVYFVIAKAFRSTGTYEFFYSRGFYQPLSLTFFLFGLLLVMDRWLEFRRGQLAAQIDLPDKITRETAGRLAEEIASKHGSGILRRRLANLLRGCARGEEIGALEERLKSKDRNELDQSASLISWVRSLPPLIGLLGTLDGLRGGIAEISMINNANDLEALRSRLQQFAHHASTAFDTTLLGISAAAALSAAIFLVRKTEDTYLSYVDGIADELTRRFTHESETLSHVNAAVTSIMAGVSEQFGRLLSFATGPIVAEFAKQLQGGVSDSVHGWLTAWQQELSRTSVEVLKSVQTQSATSEDAVRSALDRNTAQITASLSALENAVARPRPLQIRVSEDGMTEAAASGR